MRPKLILIKSLKFPSIITNPQVHLILFLVVVTTKWMCSSGPRHCPAGREGQFCLHLLIWRHTVHLAV